MLAAARLAGLAYIVNVVIDEDKRTVAAFAGNPVSAHRAGCDFLLSYARVKPAPAEIVITSNGGAPLDQNVYQCAKSISAAEATCKPGGVIIECAECLDGHGAVSMYDELHNCKSTRELYDYIMTVPADKTTPDQWETQIYCRILNNFTVIFVTRPELKGMIEDMKMKHANTLDEALEMARAMGKESITVIPNGISVIVGE
jgi:nickel-dependent lactate racemase